MVYPGTRVPEMAKSRLCIAASPQPETGLHKEKTCEGDAGHLANLAYCRR